MIFNDKLKDFLFGSLFFFGALFPACGQEHQSTTIDRETATVAAPDSISHDTLLAELPVEKSVKIIGVGDMMLGTNYPSTSYLPPN